MEKPSLSVIFEGHKAESERLGRLCTFVTAHSPFVGQTKGYEIAIEVPEDIEEARNRAIIEAYRAIERISKLSFIPGEGSLS